MSSKQSQGGSPQGGKQAPDYPADALADQLLRVFENVAQRAKQQRAGELRGPTEQTQEAVASFQELDRRLATLAGL
jgi:hypothetical protein